jgi:MFS transporter, PAT family, beta-lactamase induction signal transducer AmpG
MTLSPSNPIFLRVWRQFSLLILGFASGLPLALTGQTMQAWLTTAGLATAAIGMFSLIGTPYLFKFVWAPLMDRFEPPFLGRRRGWIVLTQLAIAALVYVMATIDPIENTLVFSMVAVGVAFLSSSQDIVIDAYRTDVAPAPERGLSASMSVFGYRLGMILSGGAAFVMADSLGWAAVYKIIAFVMVGLAIFSTLTPLIPSDEAQPQRQADFSRFVGMVAAACLGYFGVRYAFGVFFGDVFAALGVFSASVIGLLALGMAQVVALGAGRAMKFAALKDVTGFIYMLFGAMAGYYLADILTIVVRPFTTELFTIVGFSAVLVPKWVDLFEVIVMLCFALPCAYFGAKWSQFELLIAPLHSYFERDAAKMFLALIILYKLGDAFAGNLLSTFLLKGVQFSLTEVGLVNKLFGMIATIGGALLGGFLMIRLGLYRSLVLFGFLQAVTTLAFWGLAEYGKDVWGHLTIHVGAITRMITNSQMADADVLIDNLLLFSVTFENLASGMGTAAFVALLMSLTRGGHTLTHYALLSALATVGRIFVGPISGVLSETIGWPAFFIFATLTAVPGMLLLVVMKKRIQALT